MFASKKRLEALEERFEGLASKVKTLEVIAKDAEKGNEEIRETTKTILALVERVQAQHEAFIKSQEDKPEPVKKPEITARQIINEWFYTEEELKTYASRE